MDYYQYKPSFPFKNGHLSTIFPALVNKERPIYTQLAKIDTEDDDFYEVETIVQGKKKAAILLHGLEGSSRAQYMTRLAGALTDTFDIHAINMRGCGPSGPNRLVTYYHSGWTSDLHHYIKCHCQSYDEVVLVGVSVGGNIVSKYLGEQGSFVDPRISKAFVVSVPFDLAGSATILSKGFNKVYLERFLKRLKKKVQLKKEMGFSVNDYDAIMSAKDFQTFDSLNTAPCYGYQDANHYWKENSSLFFLSNIKIPVLSLSSLDDPFLSNSCYPNPATNEHIIFVNTNHGGHVGYRQKQSYFYEKIAASFLA